MIEEKGKKMNKRIKGDLVLTRDRVFKESIEVEGNIVGYYNLKVIGNIHARDIEVLDIHARDIEVLDIHARDIEVLDILFCESIKLKANGKIKAKVLIQNRSKLEQKEWKV